MRKSDGTGLGLWISSSLVEGHGVDITAANRPTAEGGGAVFRVLLLGEPEAGLPALASDTPTA